MMDLPHRVRRLEDRFEILELVNTYALAVDDRDWDAVEQMYAEEAVFDAVVGRHEGRQAVVAYYRERTAGFGATFHIPHNLSLTFQTEDRATGIVAAHAELAIDGVTFLIALRYHDTYVREEGRWRFLERDVKQLYAAPAADLPTVLAADDRKRWPGTDRAPADWGAG